MIVTANPVFCPLSETQANNSVVRSGVATWIWAMPGRRPARFAARRATQIERREVACRVPRN
jgi:hypothetical protein